ncbi:MAG: hypothetical protein EBZ77_17780, partial [Chitinophagia bacterium]|nr:hypothetical protein [Chitinophagia bacterium]
IPLSLPAKDLFSLLSSLVVRGVKVESRGSLMLALLALHCKVSVLEDKAREYVQSRRGLWFSKADPENYVLEFVKFILNTEAQYSFLLPEERTMFEEYRQIAGWRINGNTTVLVKTGYTSHKMLRPDFKEVVCKLCDHKRSFTLMSAEGICGLCIYDPQYGRATSSLEGGQSYMCECRTCKVHYAVENIGNLRIQPKCHFCRTSISRPPPLQCRSCFNTFLGSQEDQEDWTCRVCQEEGLLVEDMQVPIREIVRNMDHIFSGKSLWALCGEDRETKLPVEVEFIEKLEGKKILNRQEMIDKVLDWVSKGISEFGVCMSCMEDMGKHKLRYTCNRKNCKALSCEECIKTWYG